MPAQVPPEAQSIGRARGRLSASSSQPFRDVKSSGFELQNWFERPLSPHQVMGIEVEDSFCSILMKRAPVVNSIEELTKLG